MSNPFVNPGGTSVGSTNASIAAAAAASQANNLQNEQTNFENQITYQSAKSVEFLKGIVEQLDIPGKPAGTKFYNVLIAQNSIIATNSYIYSFHFNANDKSLASYYDKHFVITDLNVRTNTYFSLYETGSSPNRSMLSGQELIARIISAGIINPVTGLPITSMIIEPDRGFFYNDNNTYTFYFYADGNLSYYLMIDQYDSYSDTYSSIKYTGDIINLNFINTDSNACVSAAFAKLTYSGQYVVAIINNTVKYSSNGGITWNSSDLPLRAWCDIDISDDGKYATVVSSTGEIYRSSNYGQNWINVSILGITDWLFVNINNTGQIQYVSRQDLYTPTGIHYISNDYGNTWKYFSIYGPYGLYYINISNDGRFVVIIDSVDDIWISSDYASTFYNYSQIFSIPNYGWKKCNFAYSSDFITIINSSQWIFRIIFSANQFNLIYTNLPSVGYPNPEAADIVISENGLYQYIITKDGRIFYSNDFGTNWNPTPIYNFGISFASGVQLHNSIDSNYMIMNNWGGSTSPGIFLSSSIGTTKYPLPLVPIIDQYTEQSKIFPIVNDVLSSIIPDRYFTYNIDSLQLYVGKSEVDVGYNIDANLANGYYIQNLSFYLNPNYIGYTGTVPGITGNMDTKYKYLMYYDYNVTLPQLQPIQSQTYDYLTEQEYIDIENALQKHILYTNSSITIYETNVNNIFIDYVNDTYDLRFSVNDSSNISYNIYGLNLTNNSYDSWLFVKSSTNVNIPITVQLDNLYNQLLETQPTYEILDYTKDNYNPITYSGNLVGSMEATWYDIELLSVMVPNKPLKNAYNIGAFPYFYIVFHTQNLKNKNLIYSNNNSSSYATFIVRSITADTNNNYSYLNLSSTKQRMKFKPNEDLIFSIFEPSGKLLEFEQKDYFSPYPPINDFQISAVINITRVADEKTNKDSYSKILEINSLRRNRNAYPNPANFTALFNQNATVNTNSLNALDPVYLSIPQYVFRTNSNRISNTTKRVNSVSTSDTSLIYLDKGESSANGYLVGYNILLFYYGSGNVTSTPTYIFDRMIYNYNGVNQCATINRSLPAVSGLTGQLPYSKNTLTYVLYDKTFSSNAGFINKYGVQGCTGTTINAGPIGITGSTGTTLYFNPNENIIPFTNFKTKISDSATVASLVGFTGTVVNNLAAKLSRNVLIIEYPVPDPNNYPLNYYYPPPGFFDFCYITINIDGLDPGTPCQNNILTNTRKIINTEVDFSQSATPTTLVLYLEQELNYVPQPGSVVIINNSLDNLNLYPSVSTQFTDIYGTNNVRTESGYDNFYVDYLLENTLSKEFKQITSYKNIINLAETKSPYNYTNISDNFNDINSYINYDVVYTIRQQRPLDYMYIFPTQTLPTVYGSYDINNLPDGYICDPPASIVNYINAGSPNGLTYLVLDSRSSLEPKFYQNLYIRFTKNLDSNYDLTCRIVKYYPYMSIYDKTTDPPTLKYQSPIYMIEFDNFATATQQLQSNPGKILTITISSVSSVFKLNG